MSENLSTAHAHAQQVTNFNDMVEYQRKLIHEQSEQILRLKEDRKPKKTDEQLVEVPLVNGGVAIIDQDSPAMEYKVKWRMDHYGYVVWNTSKTVNRIKKHISIKMHSIVLPPRRELVIDHINGNKLDNRRSNLRYATREENSFNSGASKNNKSGAKGVRRLKKFSNKPFTAQIKYKGRCMWLGSFATLEEASDAYQAAADKYFGEFKRAALAVVREANHE